MGDAADDAFDAALKVQRDIDALKAAGIRPCDICEGEGHELDADGNPEECHLCEGAGYFDEDGFPVDIADIL